MVGCMLSNVWTVYAMDLYAFQVYDFASLLLCVWKTVINQISVGHKLSTGTSSEFSFMAYFIQERVCW